MKTKSSEIFHESLLAQYREQIHEALLESEADHKTRIDIGKLNFKLNGILKAAKSDGISDIEINQLIDNATALKTCKKAA